VLDLKQGLGRLLRSRRDRGILAVLDPRLTTRRYGRAFLKSLPPYPVVRDVDGCRKFFNGEPSA
jgi:ATP-dependent DNA helicase DinG